MNKCNVKWCNVRCMYKFKKAYCKRHYNQINIHGKISITHFDIKEPMRCKVRWCKAESRYKTKIGYCQRHHQQIQSIGIIKKTYFDIRRVRLCKLESCNSISVNTTKDNYCQKHYLQVKKYGKIGVPDYKLKKPVKCKVKWCKDLSYRVVEKSYCFRHYCQLRDKGIIKKTFYDFPSSGICKVDNCKGKPVNNSGITGLYCQTHYYNILRNGKIKRTKHDKNEIIIKNDYALIVIRNLKQKINGHTKVDIKDVDKLKNLKWSLHTKGRVRSHKKGFIYHVILGFKFKNYDKVVDHINGDTMDNRRKNLRIVSQMENVLSGSRVRK